MTGCVSWGRLGVTLAFMCACHSSNGGEGGMGDGDM